MQEAMSNRERILSTIYGRPVDRFPVWLKMHNRTWRSSQPKEIRDLSGEELLTAAGCDLMLGCDIRACSESPHVTVQNINEDSLRRCIVETPEGVLVGEDSLDPFTNSWHPTRFMGETLEDFRKLHWLYRDTRYWVENEDAENARNRRRELEKRDVFTSAGVGPGPLMQLDEHLCGPQATIYHEVDDHPAFQELMELMHQDRIRMLKALLPHCAADTLWLTENTSTTLISPDLFRRYCMPHLTEYANLILEQNVIPVHHMCGTLNALLEDIDGLPALVNEAFTTRPLGDVSLAEGRSRMPSKALIGGTNATLWLSDPEEIAGTVEEDLNACPDRRKIFLTSAGVLPPLVSLEKARRVTDAFRTFPAD